MSALELVICVAAGSGAVILYKFFYRKNSTLGIQITDPAASSGSAPSIDKNSVKALFKEATEPILDRMDSSNKALAQRLSNLEAYARMTPDAKAQNAKKKEPAKLLEAEPLIPSAQPKDEYAEKDQN